MTLDELQAAFPRGCQVRRRDTGVVCKVVGYSAKYDALYVRRRAAGRPLLLARGLLERCDEPEMPPQQPPQPTCVTAIEEHW